jgi:DNA repair exonuclease SbcCD nuclease subunit
MTTYKFVHAADLHLDSPFDGKFKDAARIATALRAATFRAYEAIINLCIDEQVDALLIAGDVYDGADRSLGAQLHFRDGLQRLADAGIRAFVCHGNHDPLDGWEAKLEFPPNVVRFGKQVSSEPLRSDDPKSPMVYGISYPTRDVRDNLVSLFPAAEAGRYCIGLLHANVGANTEHEPYAPCSLDDLAGTGYDYWALGHVHTRAVLREANPVIAYPGNPQGRHINESGERGAYLVEVDEHGETAMEFRALDETRWERIYVAIEDFSDEQTLLDAVDQRVEAALAATDGRSLIYRLSFHGRGPVHAALARPGFMEDLRERGNAQYSVGVGFAFCERMEDGSAAEVNRDALRDGQDLLGDLLTLIDEADADDGAVKESLRVELAVLYEHRTAGRYLDLESLALDEVIVDAERRLIDELLDGREG